MGTLNVNVLYFAHVRERVGLPCETLVLPEGANVGDAVAAIIERHPGLEPLIPVVRFALDGAFVTPDAPLWDRCEVVLIPPVAGGLGTDDELVAIVETPLEGRSSDLEALVCDATRGAVVTFQGRVRDHARGRIVTALEYEAYPSMALTQLRRIVDEVERAHPGVRCAVHHRTGSLGLGDVAVIIAVSHAHRAPAFRACELLIDRLKQDVPIWKRETGPDGSSWVSDRP